MNKTETSGDILPIVLGAATAVGVGSFILQAMGVFVLGLIGAFAGWVFNHLLKPKLNKFLKKITEKTQ